MSGADADADAGRNELKDHRELRTNRVYIFKEDNYLCWCNCTDILVQRSKAKERQQKIGYCSAL